MRKFHQVVVKDCVGSYGVYDKLFENEKEAIEYFEHSDLKLIKFLTDRVIEVED